jgi:hypothetical protein
MAQFVANFTRTRARVFMQAATMGKLDALKALVGKGASMTTVSKSGLTMLMAAAFWG